MHESFVKCSSALLKSHAAHRSLLFPMTWPRSTVFRCFPFCRRVKIKFSPQKVPLVCSRSSMFAQSFRSGLSSLLVCRICPPSVCVYCSPWAFFASAASKSSGSRPGPQFVHILTFRSSEQRSLKSGQLFRQPVVCSSNVDFHLSRISSPELSEILLTHCQSLFPLLRCCNKFHGTPFIWS